jgi:carotenoid cleavage dioxygenase-like enzyme
MLLPMLLLWAVSLACGSNVGWQGFLKENPTEFHDLLLSWEGAGSVPAWLSGTYVRNGPAQVITLKSFREVGSLI